MGSHSFDKNNESIIKYFEEISAFAQLPPEEEVKLSDRVQKGEAFALNKLVKANLRFVISVAKQYQNRGLPLEDLISEGNLGLITAAQKFDATRGFKFISYAVWWIRQSMLKALAEQTRMVRLPMNRIGNINKVNKEIGKLRGRYGREPSLSEIAENINMAESDVTEALNGSKNLSLDQPIQQETIDTFMKLVEQKDIDSPDEILMQESLRKEIETLLEKLKPREAEVLRMSFGLIGERPLKLEEIGNHFSLTRERIRQIKVKALLRLRRHNRSDILKKYLG